MSAFLFATNVAFEFPNGRKLFDAVHVSLGSSLTALVGPNGVGKSTLAAILAGTLEPTSGAVRRHESIGYVPQRVPAGAESVASVLLAAYAGSSWGEQLLEGIDRDASCNTLSGGQWMRVRLACALDQRFLVLDEPTNDLDSGHRALLFAFLRAHRRGALIVSHDRSLLRLCGDVLELSNQGLARYGEGWEGYERAKIEERERASRGLDRAKRERTHASTEYAEQVARQEKRNQRGAREAKRGGMPKILLGGRKRRAQVTSGQIDARGSERANEAVRVAYETFRKLKVEPVMYADIFGEALPPSALVAEARDFNVRHARWLYSENLNFTWRGNVRVAIAGANGSGKSSLLRVLLGEKLETRGQFQRGERKTLYVDQRCAVLDDRKSVFENVRAVSSLSDSEIRNGLAKFLFAKDQVFLPVSALSGGERLRAALARGFLAVDRPNLLVLDEPTNNVDLANVEFLERFLRAFPGALVVVSHDDELLKNVGIEKTLILTS